MSKLFTLLLLVAATFLFQACQKELSFIDPVNTVPVNSGTAVFSFAGAPGNCTSPVINGIYKAGVPADSSNWILVKVDVTSPGTYTISTAAVNGISFSGSGGFVQAGAQVIKLQAIGTPVADGTFNFSVGVSSCQFPVTCIAGSPQVAGCKDCVYVPMCVGIKYSYNDTTSGIASVRAVEFLSSVDTTIGSRIFKKITATNGVTYLNCTNGETTVIAYQPVSTTGNTLQKYEGILIKANAPIAATWSDTVMNAAGQQVIQKSTIQTKGVTRQLGGVTFNNIIVVNLETGINVPGMGWMAGAFTKYLYAKDIGLVETIMEDPVTGQVMYHSVIKSYFIP